MKAFQKFSQHPIFLSFRQASTTSRHVCRSFQTASNVFLRTHTFSNQSLPLIQLLRRHSLRSSLRQTTSKSCQAPSKRFQSTKPPFNPTPNLGSPEPALSLTQRLRKLSREYGWSAVGVYFLLTAIDFPFCFIAVRMLGTDRVGHWEHVAVDWFWSVVPWPFPEKEEEAGGMEGKGEEFGVVAEGAEIGVAAYDHGVKEAEQMNKSENASIWTQLALAYAIHKSFIFIRVPLTAALTPKVVRVLRGWGWNIGKRKPKAVKSSQASDKSSKD